MSKSAVTMITNDLIKEGQLKEIGITESSLGRKPILLDIVADYRFAIGVSLHRKRISILITDLKSTIIDCIEEKTENFYSAEEAIQWICNTTILIMQKNKLDNMNCIGVGISSPGPLNYKTGEILTPPDFDLFHHIPIVERIQQELHLPAILENNAVLLAITEYYYGSSKDYRNSLFVIISNGIGSSIINDGQIYRGFEGFAGELGHTSVDLHGLPCSCGNCGCLEQYATLANLQKHFNFKSYEQVVNDAYNNMEYASEIINYLAEYLSSAITNAINFMDLDAVVIYGEYNYRPELLISSINNLVKQRSVIKRAHEVAILSSKLGSNAAVMSSTSAILNSYFCQKLI